MHLFVQRRWLESQYHVRTAHAVVKVQLSRKEKYRPRSAAMDFVGVKRRQNESGVLRGGTFFLGNHPLKVVVITVSTTTFSAGFGIKGIMEVQVRQYGFGKFIVIK